MLHLQPIVSIILSTLLLSALVVSRAQAEDIGPKVGQTAPEFSIKDLKEKPHSLKEMRAKGHVLVVFWSTRCHVCHQMLPEFKRLHKEYSGKGLTLVAINVGFEDKDEVDTYVLENKIDYLVLNDDLSKGDVAEAYRLIGTPTIQLIAPDGTVKFRGHHLPDLAGYLSTKTSGLSSPMNYSP